MTIARNATSALAKAVNLFKAKDTTADELEAELERLDAAAPARVDAVARAKAARREAVLSGEADKIARAEAALTSALQQGDHALIVREELVERLQARREAEKAEAAKAAYDRAAGLQRALLAAARDMIPRLAAEGVRLQNEAREVADAIALANANLPAGAEPIPDPELVLFGAMPRAEKIIRERETFAWVWPVSGQRLPDDAEVRVDPEDPDRGWVYGNAVGEREVERRRFRVIVALPGKGPTWPDRGFAALSIPSLSDPGRDDRSEVETWQELSRRAPAEASARAVGVPPSGREIEVSRRAPARR